jgi:hypothetical protein
MDLDKRIRSAIEQHGQASERGDTEVEHLIYAVDAILDYPQSRERFPGRATISRQRGGHPATRLFAVGQGGCGRLVVVAGGLSGVLPVIAFTVVRPRIVRARRTRGPVRHQCQGQLRQGCGRRAS